MAAHFQVPLNLPHAATVAIRITSRLAQTCLDPDRSDALITSEELVRFLYPFKLDGENPSTAESIVVASEALALARELVDQIVAEDLVSDRVGQSVRNLFECLERGSEGAWQGLRAGEDPQSIQRPV